jgi:hypothetical protein
MKYQYENQVMSSFLLFVDHEITNKGEAYSNYSSYFYPVNNIYNGYYTYSAPFKQLVVDESITGPAVMKSIYIDSSLTAIGVGGLAGINHYEGELYFTSEVGGTISGSYAVKDFNVYLTNEPEEKILFEEKYHINTKTTQVLSGLHSNMQTYPAIYLKNFGGDNQGFAFGGINQTTTQVRAVILADSSFALDAACSILKDTHMKQVPIIEDLPFSAMNAYTGSSFNYTGLATGSGPRIEKVYVSKDVARGIGPNPSVFSAFVDFDLKLVRS